MSELISKKVQAIAPSGIRVFFDLVLAMKDVISLGVGEPDFVTPWTIRETGIYSLEKGLTTYTSNKGLLKLRLHISNYLKKKFSLNYDPEEEILITTGSSEALDLAIRTIINPDEKILVPDPSYVSYAPITILAGGKPVYLKTNCEQNFKIMPEQINKICDKKTKAIILNYPSNPTGTSYTRDELEKIKESILDNNLICISDEIYGELTYDFKHTSFPSLKGAKSKTIYLGSFSKAFAMTGWRVGFACGPKELIGAMTKVHQYTMLCAPTISQFAACEALQNGYDAVEEMKKEYRRRRELLFKNLNAMGLDCILPHGAFYVFPSIRKTGLDSLTFANLLLKEKKVALVPGTAFGPSGEGHVRISYSVSFDRLKEALSRIGSFLKSLK